MLLGLKGDIIYGPVQSRRLGRSLGVNLLPPSAKFCTFDCLYCQYGWTGAHARVLPAGLGLPSVEEILRAVEEALALVDDPPAYVTFSGNGEPTLHPAFPAIVDGVIALRDRLSPGSRTAVLSNSTTVDGEGMRGALARLDVRIMKLDAGSEALMERFNRPCAGVEFERIVAGLAALEDVTIQALFTGGTMGNAASEAVDRWVECIERISPSTVQIYTLDRDYPSRQISPLSKPRLLDIAGRLAEKGIRACVF